MADLGERTAAVEAVVKELQQYERDRWHKLDNDLQTIFNLPREITRDLAKLEERLEAMVDKAVERALGPVISNHGKLSAEVDSLKDRLSELEGKGHQLTGQQRLGHFLIQTILATILAGAAVFGLRWGHG
jgi:predicted nuclease with TOPRIM domain